MWDGSAVFAIDKFFGLLKHHYREGLKFVEVEEQSLKEEQQIKEGLAEYARRYLKHHGAVKVLHGRMKEPRPLESIYTSVKILDNESVRDFSDPDNLEQLFRREGRDRFQSNVNCHDGLSVAKDKQYLMVLGGPGIGKSTFLRKLGLEALKGQNGSLQSEQFPVFLELKLFEGGNLKTLIVKAFETCGIPEAEKIVGSMLKDGELLILLDGLDEVPNSDIDKVSNDIETFVINHDKNKFVASCRTAYRRSFNQFTDVTIADFDDEQIQHFIQQWFNDESDQQAGIAQAYWDALQQPENTAAKELARTPLLLTFLCLVYDRKQMLPRVRSTLYEQALDILLQDWAAEKRLKPDLIRESLHPSLEKVMLSKIAYDAFEKDKVFFSKAKLVNDITEFSSKTLNKSEPLYGEAILKAIEKQQGILVERVTGFYSFSHLTFQEYLTASYIVKKQQRVDELISQHLTKKRWREVFLLVAGLMEDRIEELATAIDQKARTYINHQPKIINLLKWADRVTQESASELKGFEKRAIALFLASTIARASNLTLASTRASDLTSTIARALARAYERASASAHSSSTLVLDFTRINAHELAYDLAYASGFVNEFIEMQIIDIQAFKNLPMRLISLKDKIPQPYASNEEWQSYVDELCATYLNAFDLTEETLSLTETEWQSSADHLYATELLVRCRHSSIVPAHTAWEAIESQLLKF